MHGALPLSTTKTTISAVKKRESGHARAKKRKGGWNVMWKRITENFDDAVRQAGADPRIGVPLTRLVLFQHLTPTQGMAGRRYADIVRNYERFCVANGSRSPRSANLEPVRGVKDQELERIHVAGKLREYEAAAKVAKREYRRVMKVLDKFVDPVTGRNFAKDSLDNLCIFDREPSADARASIGAVLSMIAKEFGMGPSAERKQ
jgi:muconolactone delta-isomerase